MVAEVGVHDDDEVARHELQAVHVGRPEAELSGASLEDDVGFVGFLELLCDRLGAVGGAVVYDDEFPVEVAARRKSAKIIQGTTNNATELELKGRQDEADVLLREGPVKEPSDDGEVALLIVGRENHGVLVLRHCGLSTRPLGLRERVHVVGFRS